MATEQQSLTSPLLARVRGAIAEAGGWLPFDRFMAMALYEPGLGYYANALAKFGQMPQSGSDFVTAPELTPLFGQTLARQVAQALAATGTDEVWEFGAGTGALALQVIEALAILGQPLRSYTIVERIWVPVWAVAFMVGMRRFTSAKNRARSASGAGRRPPAAWCR